MSFRDERIEEKGYNLFQATIILSFRDGKDNKTLVGKSTLKSVRKCIGNGIIPMTEFMNDAWYNSDRNELEEEAKRAALSVFFKEVYGYTDTSNIAVDEFDRPRNDKTGQSFPDCSTIDLTTES